jgi:hypothetical protein
MAKAPILPLLIGAGALFFLSKKDDEEKKKDADKPPKKDKIPEGGGFQTGKTPTQPAERTPEMIADLEAYLNTAKFKAKGHTEDVTVDDLPDFMDETSFFLSDDCNVATVGAEFEKPYILIGEGPNEEWVDPVKFWQAMDATGSRPNDSGPDETDLSTAMRFSLQLFQETPCYEKIPKPGSYSTRQAYDNAWTHFLNAYPALSKLFMGIHNDYVVDPMMEAWGQKNPVGFKDWKMREVVADTIEDFPGYNTEDLTDEAYFRFYDGDADMPQVIDPSNPSHQPYMQTWLELQTLVVEMK